MICPSSEWPHSFQARTAPISTAAITGHQAEQKLLVAIKIWVGHGRAVPISEKLVTNVGTALTMMMATTMTATIMVKMG